MRTLLNILAFMFLLGWVMCLILLKERVLIHILLVLGVFTFVMSLLSEEESA